MKKLLLVSILLLSFHSLSKHKNAYQIFDRNGKKVSFDKFLTKTIESDIVLFGEYHDNPIVHWLQYEYTKKAFEIKGEKMSLGFEMFERDQQLLINSYLKGKIKERNFIEEMRLWPNYTTDYKPLLEFGNQNKLKVIATNIPRKYASIVYKQGISQLDTLPKNELNYIVPLPFDVDTTLSQYKEIMEMMNHSSGYNMVLAQAIKDATMAYSIHQYFNAGDLFLHFNGCFHSDYDQGIEWYLKKLNPSYIIATISVAEQEDLKKLDDENKGKADFIICIDPEMTKTH